MNSEKEVKLVPDVLSSVLNYLDLITAQFVIRACSTQWSHASILPF